MPEAPVVVLSGGASGISRSSTRCSADTVVATSWFAIDAAERMASSRLP